MQCMRCLCTASAICNADPAAYATALWRRGVLRLATCYAATCGPGPACGVHVGDGMLMRTARPYDGAFRVGGVYGNTAIYGMQCNPAIATNTIYGALCNLLRRAAIRRRFSFVTAFLRRLPTAICNTALRPGNTFGFTSCRARHGYASCVNGVRVVNLRLRAFCYDGYDGRWSMTRRDMRFASRAITRRVTAYGNFACKYGVPGARRRRTAICVAFTARRFATRRARRQFPGVVLQ